MTDYKLEARSYAWAVLYMNRRVGLLSDAWEEWGWGDEKDYTLYMLRTIKTLYREFVVGKAWTESRFALVLDRLLQDGHRLEAPALYLVSLTYLM